jgi:hypothetical protein
MLSDRRIISWKTLMLYSHFEGRSLSTYDVVRGATNIRIGYRDKQSIDVVTGHDALIGHIKPNIST